ncbi:hypothetical protein [Salinivibrio kushneri]|uniref:Uncharacterized protein n=1 Tax=Salinivibrio kushneri TaxID=1908198 RepID=A0AB36K6W5_9GAMM|nr:hypothetical protein [Salinivibrio kushneri]OOE43915.1 hypothetical protein BZG09_08945 [Salinivibrio kushneri]
MLYTRCHTSEAVAHTRFDSYCESCSLDVALGLLSACRLSDNAVKALIASGWDMPVTTLPHYSATEIAKELGVSPKKWAEWPTQINLNAKSSVNGGSTRPQIAKSKSKHFGTTTKAGNGFYNSLR